MHGHCREDDGAALWQVLLQHGQAAHAVQLLVVWLVFLPGDKHTGSSQYDVYSLDGMAGDWPHEDGEEVKGGGGWREEKC